VLIPAERRQKLLLVVETRVMHIHTCGEIDTALINHDNTATYLLPVMALVVDFAASQVALLQILTWVY
jgi:hypothetical protein